MKTPVLILLLLPAGSVLGQLPEAGPLESLTLEQALEMAERLQPELAEARALIEAAEGREGAKRSLLLEAERQKVTDTKVLNCRDGLARSIRQ